MLLTESVKIKWNGNSRKHYENLGYKWTKLNDEFIVNVYELTPCSVIKVEVKCDGCGKIIPLKWEDYLRRVKEDGKYYCKKCASQLYGARKIQETMLRNSGKSFYDWCIENDRLDILSRWSDKNKLTPKEVGYGSGKQYYFKCPRGLHEDELAKLNTLTSFSAKSIECSKCNSFAQFLLDTYGKNALDLYWDYDKNTVNPWDINKGNKKKKVWIKCQEKDYHIYEISCLDFYTGRRCGFCGNFKIHILDSLGTLYPDIFKIWSEKNKKSPYEYSPSSHEKVWWKCEEDKHKGYYRSVKETNKANFRCPACAEDDKLKRMHSLVGENNYNYNPALTDKEREFGRYKLYGESHKKWRKQVFERDGFTCQCCGKKGHKLNAHHLDGWNWAKDKRYDINNGITLCKECHLSFHNEYGAKDNTKEQYKEFLFNTIRAS